MSEFGLTQMQTDVSGDTYKVELDHGAAEEILFALINVDTHSSRSMDLYPNCRDLLERVANRGHTVEFTVVAPENFGNKLFKETK